MKKSSLLFTLLTLIQVATAGAQTLKPGISGGQNSGGGGRCAAAQEQTQSSDGSQSSSQSNCKPGQTQAQGRDKDGSTWQTQSQVQDVALGQPGVNSQEEEEEVDTAKDVSHIYSFAAYAIEKFYKKDISALLSSGGLFEGVTITSVESASTNDDNRVYKVSYVGIGNSTSVQSVFVEISSISREQQERQTQAAFPDAANNHMTRMTMTWSGYQPQTLKLRVMGSRR